MENSYIFPQGTRPADTPRATTPADKKINPRIDNAIPIRPAFVYFTLLGFEASSSCGTTRKDQAV